MKDTTQAPETDSRDSGVLSNPISFLRSGSYSWNGASLGWRSDGGTYWSLLSANTDSCNNLNFGGTYISPLYDYNRGHGFAVP